MIWVEGFLNHDTDSLDCGTGLFDDLNQAFSSLAISKEIVDNQNLVLW
ncbi:Uncharacterised protein [Streptococcus pneumoniae]|nr:Uncharacterised protein [Streptococcus pneumoniae]